MANDVLTTRSVFDSIARCSNAVACFEGSSPSPCRSIVDYQRREYGARSFNEFQVPEPWVGEIDIAPILFVASNPSIGEDDHARGDADPDIVWESHHLAFGGGRRTYIDEGIRTTREDGSIIKPVRYWASVRARARELIPERLVVPGRDYAMTEIVHCKSASEAFGVAEAAETCVDRHLENVMSIAAARIIVAMGAIARRWLLPGATDALGSLVEKAMGGKTRLVVSLAHPGDWGGDKTFASVYSPEQIALIRARLT